jgi:hypothetical protein
MEDWPIGNDLYQSNQSRSGLFESLEWAELKSKSGELAPLNELLGHNRQ